MLGITSLIALAMMAHVKGEADWLEVATPGRKSELSLGEKSKAVRPVLALTPFDGRIYITLSAASDSETNAEILSFDPASEEQHSEFIADSTSLGRFRVYGDTLYLTDAGPREAEVGGGYFVSTGGKQWERVKIVNETAQFFDVARFDGKTFVAGSMQDRAVVTWKKDDQKAWNTIALTNQSARWSKSAYRFLVTSDHLALLSSRSPDPEPLPPVAPVSWGAWYLLHYSQHGSDRGFMFDGPARPLPALRLLAPGSQLALDGFSLSNVASFQGGLLYTVLSAGGTITDEKAGLYRAHAGLGNPQVGKTLMAKRMGEFESVRDIAIEGNKCYMLITGNAAKAAQIKVSADLKNWSDFFTGSFDASPLSIAVVTGECFVGLADGSLVKILKE